MWRDLFQRLVEDFEIHVYIDLQSYYKINTNKDETQISNKSLYFLSIKKKQKKTTLSEQFQNQLSKS